MERHEHGRPLDVTEIDIERFWSKVDKSRECWIWKAAVDKDGYGKYQYGPHRRQRHVRAHRFAFLVTRGDPGRRLIRHRCDNPGCVRPEHLLPGTQKENVADAVQRGRRPLGERHPNSKMTTGDVAAIRQARSAGVPAAELATRYGVSKAAVYAVASRRNWRHVE